ncbi:Hypothetical protein SMAX5B_016304 [Scophthalmus maximus]|uniref:Ig-like domain-containing protein n=1 Tax=Scophthalmus maximus TaxID=52904 RepID=A0A2U9BL37_SCOMX|nr:Hypothetical protein SMAX5B_016304 [Scophthalmus maximus]
MGNSFVAFLSLRLPGGCSETLVSISEYDRVLSAGQGFTLSCEFTCLGVQHVAQLWRNQEFEDRVSLINITSIHPNVSLVLSISFATKADAGYYSCRTQPPDTISPMVLIQVAENLTTSTTTSPLTTSSGWTCVSSEQPSCAAGLKAQIWFWMLLGKSATLLLGVAFLALRYRRG